MLRVSDGVADSAAIVRRTKWQPTGKWYGTAFKMQLSWRNCLEAHKWVRSNRAALVTLLQ